MESKGFGERLKIARETRKLTQEGLAVALGSSGATVSRWEREESTPRGPALRSLANLLGVMPRWLEAGEGPMEVSNVVSPDHNGSQVSMRGVDEGMMDSLRWAAAQPDVALIAAKGLEEIRALMQERGAEMVDEFHRAQLTQRLTAIVLRRGVKLGARKFEAIMQAAWEEGEGWGSSPDDRQLGRYVDVAIA